MKKNIKMWDNDWTLHAEWSDRALDDEDRYAEDSIILHVWINIDPNLTDRENKKKLMAKMFDAYNEWIQETRY